MGMFSRKDMIRLFGPLLVEQLLAVLVGMADVVMVAAVGETAVSGVALVDSISVLVIQVLSAMATGGAVVCSQYIGKKKPDQACRAAGQLVLITAALSLLIAAVAFIGNRHLLRLIFGSVETAVMDNAQTYFWFTAMSYPFLALYNSGAALFRSMGNSKVSMKVSLAMNAINVAGNALCCVRAAYGSGRCGNSYAGFPYVCGGGHGDPGAESEKQHSGGPSGADDSAAGYDPEYSGGGNSERSGKRHVPVWKDRAAEPGFNAWHGIHRGLRSGHQPGDVSVSAGCGIGTGAYYHCGSVCGRG